MAMQRGIADYIPSQLIHTSIVLCRLVCHVARDDQQARADPATY